MISFLGYTITQADEIHLSGIAKVLNYFVEKNLTADLGSFGGDDRIFTYIQDMSKLPFVVVLHNEIPIGFGLLKHDCKSETFSHSAEFSFFIMPEHVGKGVASAMFKIMEERAVQLGIWNIFMAISSNRSDSFSFYRKMGYVECGRLPKIGYKNESYFDIVYFQKSLIELNGNL